MITPKLYGRLGNQCFQISAAIAHAKKMGVTWAIPKRTQDARYWPNYFLNEVPLANRTHFDAHDIYNEKRHCYDPIPDIASLTINGYFQSEKYFLDAKQDIGDALGFHCNKQDYIAVHVRRGDYVSQFSSQHPPLDLEYYRTAIDFAAGYGFCKFKIYSDDIAWCKQHIKNGLVHYTKFDAFAQYIYCEIKDPLEAMRDMYNAAGFIIGNSTFSLFPALLRLDNPFTIAPEESRWYGPGNSHLETIDLMPERFIKN